MQVMIGGYMREKRFKYIFKDEFGYFHRVYTLKELANGELLKDTSAFLHMGAEIVAEGLQDIGMVDCVGNHIYEGDRVELQLDRLDDSECKVSAFFEVIYREQSAGFVFKRLDADNVLYSIMKKDIVSRLYRFKGSVYEDIENEQK